MSIEDPTATKLTDSVPRKGSRFARLGSCLAALLLLGDLGLQGAVNGSSAGRDDSEVPHTKAFNIPASAAAVALKKFSEQSGLSVMFAPERVEGVVTKEVVGEMSTHAALVKLLAGTTLYAVPTKEPGAYAIRREGPDHPNE
jgi:iron complex outermembrane receptor protein